MRKSVCVAIHHKGTVFVECGAKARTNDHKPCRRFPMKNGRCPLHGGLSTGAKTKEGKHRQKMASWKHGMRSKEAIEESRCLKKQIKSYRKLLNEYT